MLYSHFHGSGSIRVGLIVGVVTEKMGWQLNNLQIFEFLPDLLRGTNNLDDNRLHRSWWSIRTSYACWSSCWASCAMEKMMIEDGRTDAVLLREA
jgi:hypothetical protein